jgi:hypothetical protein
MLAPRYRITTSFSCTISPTSYELVRKYPNACTHSRGWRSRLRTPGKPIVSRAKEIQWNSSTQGPFMTLS